MKRSTPRAAAAALALLTAPAATALEALDGRVQAHGFTEVQVRALDREFQEELDLAQLLVHLGERAVAIGPVESDRGRLLLDAVGGDQGGKALGLLAQQGPPALFLLLDLLPLPIGGVAVAHRRVAVDVRVPSDEFLGRAFDAVRKPETAALAQQLEAEDREEQQVAELLGDRLVPPLGDRLGALGRLFGQVGGHGLEGLLAVPGTPVGGAESPAHGDELGEGQAFTIGHGRRIATRAGPGNGRPEHRDIRFVAMTLCAEVTASDLAHLVSVRCADRARRRFRPSLHPYFP